MQEDIQTLKQNLDDNRPMSLPSLVKLSPGTPEKRSVMTHPLKFNGILR